MIIKTEHEIALMREAGRIVALAHAKVRDFIKPGVSTFDLDKIVEDVILGNGAKPSFKGYNGFPASICASVNEVVVHGIPNEKTILKNGDIISIDIGANYKGYHGDSAWTYAVLDVEEPVRKLMTIGEEALYAGLEEARPGHHLTDISHAISEHVRPYGFGIVREFSGHGVGSNLHEKPSIFNFGPRGHGPILKPGMTLAIEPMINLGTRKVKVLQDNWTTVTRDKSVSVHFEHTILITNNGYEILTKLN